MSPVDGQSLVEFLTAWSYCHLDGHLDSQLLPLPNHDRLAFLSNAPADVPAFADDSVFGAPLNLVHQREQRTASIECIAGSNSTQAVAKD
jgi:hypothetical protein